MTFELVAPGDPILYETMPEFSGDFAEIKPVARAMLAFSASRGIGMAAPQVGLRMRMFVVTPRGCRHFACINPRIGQRSGPPVPMYEGCITMPGNQFRVERQESIIAGWYDVHGQRCQAQFTGILARVFQHELDHLNGRVIWPTAAARATVAPGAAAGAAT